MSEIYPAAKRTEALPFFNVDASTGVVVPSESSALNNYKNIDSSLKLARTITIGDYKQLDGKSTVLFNEEVSGATETSVYNTTHNGVDMTVNANADYVVRESKVTHNYTSGNPQLFEATATNIEPVTDVIKTFGYFSSSTVAPYDTGFDGFVLETDDIDVYFRIYKNGTLNFTAAQSVWDDPMDGNGVSGLTLDKTAFQAFVCDFLYLGGTAARFGFIIGEAIVWCHTFLNANVKNSTFVQSPNKPMRWQIRSTGGVGTLTHICSKVGSIGEVKNIGVTCVEHMDDDHVNANAVGTKYALFGVRPNSRNATITITSFGGLALTADKFLLELLLNPAIVGTFTYSPVSGTRHDRATGDVAGTNTVTGGTVLGARYFDSAGDATENAANLLRMGRTISGVYDEIVLVVTPLGANLDILGSMKVNTLS